MGKKRDKFVGSLRVDESMSIDPNKEIIEGRFLDTKEAIQCLDGINPIDYTAYEYDKDVKTETEFYQQIMRNIKCTKGLDFSEKDVEEYAEALKKLGCIDFMQWIRTTNTTYPKGTPIATLIDEGDNGAAVECIGNMMLGNKKLFEKSRKSMLAVGQEKTMPIDTWLKESKNRLKELSGYDKDER